MVCLKLCFQSDLLKMILTAVAPLSSVQTYADNFKANEIFYKFVEKGRETGQFFSL